MLTTPQMTTARNTASEVFIVMVTGFFLNNEKCYVHLVFIQAKAL